MQKESRRARIPCTIMFMGGGPYMTDFVVKTYFSDLAPL